MKLSSLLPPPWNGIVGIGLPVLLLVGAFTAGDIRGRRAEGARISAKYEPKMQHAADVMALTATRIRAARAEAAAADLAHARRVETAQATATLETTDALQRQLAAARSLAAAYALRLRGAAAGAQAVGGGSGAAGQPGAAHAARGAARGGTMPELDDDDLLVCTENTVKAQGWRAWWMKISAIPR